MVNGKAKMQEPTSGMDPSSQGATTGFESELWQAANTLRGSMDAAEYKHVVLGLIFLKYVSDAFEERRAFLVQEIDQGADPEDPDEYRAHNVFWVPPEARWDELKADARESYVGETVDEAMEAIEEANPALKDVLPKDYARPILDKQRLGQLIDLVSNIAVGTEEARSKDVLGRVYEYFLSQFASAEGKRGGEFYTPRCVVKLLVEMLEPYEGRVYDPCCGSSGMFVQSVEFIEAHATGNGNGGTQPAGVRRDISIWGQEANYTTWRLAKMNLAIRGIEGQIAYGDTFHNDRHPDLKADFILANPPFNISDWGGDRLADDKRWQWGVPPKRNANFAWVQHMVHHLAPTGVAGFVLANGSMSSQQSGEGEIRKNLVEADLVDCMVALPGQLFYSTQIPACLWFLTRERSGAKHRKRKGEVLFIDAREMGTMVDQTHRELTDDDIARIADTYHAWRGSNGPDAVYADELGFCKSASLEEIREHDHILTPGRYVGVKFDDEEGEPIEDVMDRLIVRWRDHQADAAKLDALIGDHLRQLRLDVAQTKGSESWPLVMLNEVTTTILSSVDKKSKSDEVQVLLCNYMDVYKNQFINGQLNFMSATATQSEINKCQLMVGDVVITKDSEKYDDIGVPALVRDNIDRLVCGYHLAILRPDPDKICGTYLYFILNDRRVQSQFHAIANGITRFGLRKADIGRVQIPLPPLMEQKRVSTVIETLIEKVELTNDINLNVGKMINTIFEAQHYHSRYLSQA